MSVPKEQTEFQVATATILRAQMGKSWESLEVQLGVKGLRGKVSRWAPKMGWVLPVKPGDDVPAAARALRERGSAERGSIRKKPIYVGDFISLYGNNEILFSNGTYTARWDAWLNPKGFSTTISLGRMGEAEASNLSKAIFDMLQGNPTPEGLDLSLYLDRVLRNIEGRSRYFAKRGRQGKKELNRVNSMKVVSR